MRKVGIIGAGLMGTGIAQTVAQAGMDVVLADIDLAIAEKARDSIARTLAKLVEKGKIDSAAADAIVRIRLYTTPAIIGLPVLGAVLGDATGGAYGIAGATMWGCGWYWWTIRTEVGRRSAALA